MSRRKCRDLFLIQGPCLISFISVSQRLPDHSGVGVEGRTSGSSFVQKELPNSTLVTKKDMEYRLRTNIEYLLCSEAEVALGNILNRLCWQPEFWRIFAVFAML